MCLEPHPGELLNRRSLCPPFQWLRDLYSWGLRSGGYTPPSLASQTPVAPKDTKWLYLALLYPFYVLRAVRGEKNPYKLRKESFWSWQGFVHSFSGATARGHHRRVFFLDVPLSFLLMRQMGHLVLKALCSRKCRVFHPFSQSLQLVPYRQRTCLRILLCPQRWVAPCWPLQGSPVNRGLAGGVIDQNHHLLNSLKDVHRLLTSSSTKSTSVTEAPKGQIQYTGSQEKAKKLGNKLQPLKAGKHTVVLPKHEALATHSVIHGPAASASPGICQKFRISGPTPNLPGENQHFEKPPSAAAFAHSGLRRTVLPALSSTSSVS